MFQIFKVTTNETTALQCLLNCWSL